MIEMLPQLCADMDSYNRATMMIKLKENGVSQYVSTRVEEIAEGSVTLKDMETGKSLNLRRTRLFWRQG